MFQLYTYCFYYLQ